MHLGNDIAQSFQAECMPWYKRYAMLCGLLHRLTFTAVVKGSISFTPNKKLCVGFGILPHAKPISALLSREPSPSFDEAETVEPLSELVCTCCLWPDPLASPPPKRCIQKVVPWGSKDPTRLEPLLRPKLFIYGTTVLQPEPAHRAGPARTWCVGARTRCEWGLRLAARLCANALCTLYLYSVSALCCEGNHRRVVTWERRWQRPLAARRRRRDRPGAAPPRPRPPLGCGMCQVHVLVYTRAQV
jgi:hypothetical protein